MATLPLDHRRRSLAAVVIMYDALDDGFDYFRCWLVSMGRRAYEDALSEPVGLGSLVPAISRRTTRWEPVSIS